MIKRMIALCAGALALTAMTTFPALADNDRDDRDDRDRRGRQIDTSISGVFVIQNKGTESTLTIRGHDLQGRLGRDRTRVMVGGMGPLEILDGSTSNELVVRCHVAEPRFDCNDGDYKLSVTVLRPRRSRRGSGRSWVRGRATHDLTIGAVGMEGPAGPKGEQGTTGMQGEHGATGMQGNPGATGLQGEPGATGLQGDPGTRGERGERGERGLDGSGGGASVACPCYTPDHVFSVVFSDLGNIECTHGPGLFNSNNKQYIIAPRGADLNNLDFEPTLSVTLEQVEGDSINCSANMVNFGALTYSDMAFQIAPAEGMACLRMLKTAFECTERTIDPPVSNN